MHYPPRGHIYVHVEVQRRAEAEVTNEESGKGSCYYSCSWINYFERYHRTWWYAPSVTQWYTIIAMQGSQISITFVHRNARSAGDRRSGANATPKRAMSISVTHLCIKPSRVAYWVWTTGLYTQNLGVLCHMSCLATTKSLLEFIFQTENRKTECWFRKVSINTLCGEVISLIGQQSTEIYCYRCGNATW